MHTHSQFPPETQTRMILLQLFTYSWILCLISNDTSLGAGVWGPVAVTGLEIALLARLVLDL